MVDHIPCHPARVTSLVRDPPTEHPPRSKSRPVRQHLHLLTLLLYRATTSNPDLAVYRKTQVVVAFCELTLPSRVVPPANNRTAARRSLPSNPGGYNDNTITSKFFVMIWIEIRPSFIDLKVSNTHGRRKQCTNKVLWVGDFGRHK